MAEREMMASTPSEARENTAAFLAEQGIPQNPNLPLIEEWSELDPPLAHEVAERCLILGGIIAVGHQAPRELVADSLRASGFWEAVSPREREYLTKGGGSPQEDINATWRTECVQVLAWGLDLVDLDHFKPSNEDLSAHFPPPPEWPPTQFMENALLRPFEEIYQQCDLLYCLHWAARAERLGGAKVACDEGLLRERHLAINWLTGVASNWDEVSTDT